MTEELQETEEQVVVSQPPQESVAENKEPAVSDEIMEEARKYGWRPKEEFDLDPEGWVDADRFLELPSTQRKQLQDTNRDLNSKIQQLEQSSQSAMKEAARAAKMAMDQQEAQHRAQIEQIRQEQRKAAESGDMEEFDRLQGLGDELAGATPVQPVEQPKSQEYQQHLSGAEWAKDPMMWDFAVRSVTLGGENIMMLPDIEQLKYAEARVKEFFPHKFEQQKPRAQKVDGGGIGNSKPSKGVNSLPAEARAAGKEFVEAGVFKSLDDYAKAYFEGDE